MMDFGYLHLAFNITYFIYICIKTYTCVCVKICVYVNVFHPGLGR